MIAIHDPYTGDLLAELPCAKPGEVNAAIARGLTAFGVWRGGTSRQRAQLLSDVADRLESDASSFTELVRAEAGKPVRYARAEVARAIHVLRWAAGEVVRFAGEMMRIDVESHGRPGFGVHTRFPRGLVLGITPYNWPLLLAAHKIAPAVAAGNSILVKPSLFAPLSAIRLAELFRAAGAPEGLVEVVVATDEDSAALTKHPSIAMVSFTGSDTVGKILRVQAPDKPMALELGGNAWAVVFEDVPDERLPAIARRIAATGYGYAGQGCIAVQNVAVARSKRSAMERALLEATRQTPYGDTRDEAVVSGPLIHRAAANRVAAAIAAAAKNHGVVRSERCVGTKEQNEALIPPSLVIMDALPNRDAMLDNELFGPAVTLSSFDRIEDVVTQINGGRFGLQTGIFTQQLPWIESLYRDLNVGGVIVNDVPTARYDHQPYGGVKDSGFGREGVRFAMEEMTEGKFLALSSAFLGA